MISRWSLYCIFLSHGAPQKLVLAPTLSFMPWGHCYCYFFCHMIISFAVSLLLLLWGFYLLSWVFSFSRGVFSFAVSLFLLSWGFFLLPWVFPFLPCFFSFLSWSSSFRRESFLLPWVFFLCREAISFAVTVVGHRNRIAQMIFKWKFCLFFFFTRVKRVVQTFLSWTRGEDKCAWSLFPSTQRYGGTNHTFFSSQQLSFSYLNDAVNSLFRKQEFIANEISI